MRRVTGTLLPYSTAFLPSVALLKLSSTHRLQVSPSGLALLVWPATRTVPGVEHIRLQILSKQNYKCVTRPGAKSRPVMMTELLGWTRVWSPCFLLAFRVPSTDRLLVWFSAFSQQRCCGTHIKFHSFKWLQGTCMISNLGVCLRHFAFGIAMVSCTIFSTKGPFQQVWASSLQKCVERSKTGMDSAFKNNLYNNLLCWCVLRKKRSFMIQTAIPFPSEMLFYLMSEIVRTCGSVPPWDALASRVS